MKFHRTIFHFRMIRQFRHQYDRIELKKNRIENHSDVFSSNERIIPVISMIFEPYYNVYVKILIDWNNPFKIWSIREIYHLKISM